MRSCLSVLLVLLLATCPIVCGTAHASTGKPGEAGHSHGDRNHSRLPAPANDDDCVCNGALKSPDVAAQIAGSPDWQPVDLVVLAHGFLTLDWAVSTRCPGELQSVDAFWLHRERGPILRC